MPPVHTVNDIIDNRYRIVRELGRGGTGVTYRAESIQTGQTVALKELSLKGLKDWKQIELFEREARTLESLDHPAIPAYVDYFQVDTADNRLFYLAQDLAPGTSLANRVASGWRVDEAEARRIATAILTVLDYLHTLNPPVIHRDIKPQNIIRREDGHIYLVDFGAVQTVYRDTMSQGQYGGGHLRLHGPRTVPGPGGACHRPVRVGGNPAVSAHPPIPGGFTPNPIAH
jgi:serine/threonine protein kinase